MGVVPVLCFIIARSRQERIRQRALEILHKCNRQEGVWNAEVTARVAERAIAIEKMVLDGEGDSESKEKVVRELGVLVNLEQGKRGAGLCFRSGDKTLEDHISW